MNKNILILEDSVSFRMMLTETLKEAGYNVTEATDGVEGVACLDGSKLDLIVTDLNMPNMDGMAFITACRQNPAYKFIPIIMLTTVTDEVLKEQARKMGVRIWMEKPFVKETLLAAIGKLTS